ncbi:MAG: DUF4364 family protein [Ruminococcus sp.]|nr:DUF4364 family protein [Ruminococcus sp.]
MAFDTFDEGIAPGGLRSKNEIKILICYLYYSVNDRMSKNLVTEAILADELANFFEVTVAFDELVSNGNLTEDKPLDGEMTYVLSDNGKMIARQLETTLSHTVKQKSYDCALRLLSERKTARENFVDIIKTENGFNVDCRISGGEMDLLRFSLFAPTYEQAEVIRGNFLSYPQTIYKTMLGLMTRDAENVGEALEEVYSSLI